MALWFSRGVFTSVMEGPDPVSGKMMKMKYVSEITGKDTKKMTFYMEVPDRKEHSTGKIEFTRKK